MNEAWVCDGNYEGTEHSDSDHGGFRDYKPAHSLVPPPPHSSWPACAAAPPFGDLRFSDVCPKLKTLTGNAVRSTFMNEAWVCDGDYEGTEHSDSDRGAFRMILRMRRTWTRSDCCETVHSCDHTRGMAAPTHIQLATARAVALP